MNIYRRFAEIYTYGPYPGYSLTILDLLPPLFAQFGIPTRGKLLDVACGEGSFSIAMAKEGWQAAGIDRSPEMIEFARQQALQAGVEVSFTVQDMRLPFPPNRIDLVTCWYDSLNYLLSAADLGLLFQNVHAALRPGGIFLFDMNTIYGLAVGWQRSKCYIQQDASQVFEIHQTSYDYERQVASVHITAFIQQGDLWERVDEVHQERGYPLEQIQDSLASAGFEILAVFGSLRDLSAVKPDSSRVWILAKRPG
jgi:SAM-dependent methyltransferase